MTVKQLKEQLENFPDTHSVLVYSSETEDASLANGVIDGSKDRPYMKGDWPDEVNDANTVIIT